MRQRYSADESAVGFELLGALFYTCPSQATHTVHIGSYHKFVWLLRRMHRFIFQGARSRENELVARTVARRGRATLLVPLLIFTL